jgi:tagaturonate reductase
MALGFAAYLLYMKGNLNSKKHFTGQVNGTTYFIQDDLASAMAEAWKANDTGAVVDTVLANREEWDTDLAAMPGFADTVKTSLHSLMKNGVMPTLRSVKMSRTIA